MEAYMTAPRFDLSQVREALPKKNFDASLKNYSGPSQIPDLTGSSIQYEIKGSSANLPWRASTYYGTATGNPSLPNAHSMPEPGFKGHLLGQLDPVKVPPIFPAARNNLYTRYTPGNWEASNTSNLLFGDKVRAGSSQLRSEALMLCRELDEKTKRNQEDAGKSLGERIGNVEHWKEEVKTELDAMIQENQALQECLEMLEKVAADLIQPLRVAQECLYSREKRRGIDLVHDNVERELIREVDVLKKCQNESKRFIDQGRTQLALNRAAQHELEKDLSDKVVALNLDNRCHMMKDMSRDVKYYDGIHRIDNTASIPITWAQFSTDNIRRSRAERSASRDLRRAMAGVCDSISSEVEDQKNRVNDALADRLKEYQDVKNGIQQNLLKTLEEISEMEKIIELLKQSIIEKEPPLQVAQTRLATRIRRPNVEACRDKPQHRLVEEVHEINESVDQLRMKLRQSENSLQQLLKAKLSLEHDLDIKNNSIMIDREQCLGLRLSPPTVYVGTTLKV